MKHVTILVPDCEVNLNSISGAYEILTRANDYWQKIGNPARLDVQIAGFVKETTVHDRYFAIHPAYIKKVKKTDLLIIPSIFGDYTKAINNNTALIAWISKQYKNGAEIASMCSGAFLLSATGLLDGRSCSTHWNVMEPFRRMFPEVKIAVDKIITDENGIYTNGGGYSFLNLMLYLVEKFFDRPTAIFCSKIFQIEMDRQSQSGFTIFTGQKQHGDEMVQKAQAYIESRLDEKISVEHLSARFSVGRRNFDRRFIKATGNTPVEYAQRVKIESAKKAFETTRKNINEVMYDVGYSDLKAFREVFKKITGMSPLAYWARYNKEALA